MRHCLHGKDLPMSVGDSLRQNLGFWHWYPRLLCQGLTDEQLHWQPRDHPNHIMFALWHAYRSEDYLIHGLLMQTPDVFTTNGWAQRLPVAEPGDPPFGTGLNRRQIAAVRLNLDHLLDYAEAVRAAVQAYADGLSPDEGAEHVPLPFFAPVYPMLATVSRAEVVAFSASATPPSTSARSSTSRASWAFRAPRSSHATTVVGATFRSPALPCHSERGRTRLWRKSGTGAIR